VQTTSAAWRLSIAARRVRQTLTRFENGPTVLAGIVGSRIRHKPTELMYRLDDELSIVCPNMPGARVPIYEVFADNAYHLDWFTADLGDDPRALDIGGHIGCFSLAFARQHPGARVETFEASPSTAAYARRNMAINGFDDRVTVHHSAVSSSSGTLRFADNAGGSGLNGLTAPEGTPTIEVPAVTFAEALANADRPIDVVKIDTEGAEYDIVLGSDPSDWSDVQRVVMEYHPVDGHSWDELKTFFSKAGLEVAHQEIGLDGMDTDRLGTVWLSRTPLPAL
jgi:FkbM family methyltransferase